MALRILDRERTAILASLSAGVVPRIGLQHVQVGRKREVAAMLEDLKHIEEGSASVRFVVGRFGAGKSFFLNVIQAVAMERKFVVARADITTERRLHATGGQGQALYSELMKNLATRSKPDGGALGNLVERWVGDVANEIIVGGGNDGDVEIKLAEHCKPLQDLVGGYDFVTVLQKYYRAHLSSDDTTKTAAIRWLRGEYTTKTEGKRDLQVRSIIEDASFYDFLKLFARFVKIAGYSGFIVCLDELVVLSHRLNNRVARNNNYEALLRILNDCMQGDVQHLGFVFAATDECLSDKRRGLFSYEALASRLAGNRFVHDGLIDFSGPVLTLATLTPEDLYVLLLNIRRVHCAGDATKQVLPDEGLEAYLESCSQRMGASYYQTPREVVTDYIRLLNTLQQNPSADWRNLIGEIKTAEVQTVDPSVAAAAPDDDLATFKL